MANDEADKKEFLIHIYPPGQENQPRPIAAFVSKVKATDPEKALLLCADELREARPPEPKPGDAEDLGDDGLDMDALLALQGRMMGTAALENRVSQLETGYRLITQTLGLLSPAPENYRRYAFQTARSSAEEWAEASADDTRKAAT